MRVLELLRKAGAAAGLISIAEEAKSAEIPVVERKTISLQELQLATNGSPQDLEAPAPELDVAFDRVFEAVGLATPEHGWTAERVRGLLDSEELKAKTPQEAGPAVLAAMGQQQVKPEEIIKDALARDQALDSYEEFVNRKLQQRATDRKNAEVSLAREIHDRQEQLRRLKDAQEMDNRDFQQWQQRKQQMEEDLARVASLFVSDHGITVGNNKNHK